MFIKQCVGSRQALTSDSIDPSSKDSVKVLFRAISFRLTETGANAEAVDAKATRERAAIFIVE